MEIPAMLLLLAISTSADLLEFAKEVSPVKVTFDNGIKIEADPPNPTPLPLCPGITSSCNASCPKSCVKSRYRSIDGSCNNLNHPDWGTPYKPYCRLLERQFCNVTKSGKPLPNARMISKLLFPNKRIEDKAWTQITMTWGQMIAHDMALTHGVPQTASGLSVCCKDGQYTKEAQTNPQCAPIVIPPNDPCNPSDKCMEFIKTLTAKDMGCVSAKNPRDPISKSNSYLDLSPIYGQNDTHAASLRTGSGGRLATVTLNDQEWPLQDTNPQNACFADSPSETCFYSGDKRVNQNTLITILHVIFLRLHNKIADEMCRMNPHWDDEKIYQEARRLVIAMFQCIIYNEYLPTILRWDHVVKKKLTYPLETGYVDDYDASVNTCTTVEHASGSFRFFHTTIAGLFEKVSENYEEDGTIGLGRWMLKPAVIQSNDTFLNLLRGMCTQAQGAGDAYYDEEVTENLFRAVGKYGLDLRALDIERSRDHCLGSYNDARELCGMSRAKTFSDFKDHIPEKYIEKLQNIYECPDDVELSVGADLENPVTGALTGPTNQCIIFDQLYRARIGDRYFFETSDKDTSFTLGQLKSIREACSLSSLLCYAVPEIKKIQPSAFILVTALSPRISCSLIPKVDLSLWKENI